MIRTTSHAVLQIVWACLFLGTGYRASAQTPAAPLTIPADHSLANDQYIGLGFPSYDPEWSGQDLTVAASKLKTLAADNPDQMPRYASDKSGKVFARIVSPENLKLYGDKSLTISARLPQGLQYLQATGDILNMYLAAFTAGKVGGDELIELFGSTLRVSDVMLELVDEFVPTIPKDDPSYQIRMNGLASMRGGLAQVVGGALDSFAEEKNYNVAMRLRLLGYCRETFPGIVTRLSAPSQAEVLQRLDSMSARKDLGDLQAPMIQLRDAVHAAVKTPVQTP
jgi:hypothetical protein